MIFPCKGFNLVIYLLHRNLKIVNIWCLVHIAYALGLAVWTEIRIRDSYNNTIRKSEDRQSYET